MRKAKSVRAPLAFGALLLVMLGSALAGASIWAGSRGVDSTIIPRAGPIELGPSRAPWGSTPSSSADPALSPAAAAAADASVTAQPTSSPLAPLSLASMIPTPPPLRAPAGPDSREHPHAGTPRTPAAAPRIIRHGPRTGKVVALTFDDGWNPDACESIARTLRATGAVATFFVNGMRLQLDPRRWREILQGFPVANHTRSHRWLTRIGRESAERQIRTNQRIHEDILGRPMLKILRPPYGAYDETVLEVAVDLGYRDIVLWDTSSGDTSSEATVGTVVRHAMLGRNGSIVLMHCGPSVTPRALPAIIRGYRSRGFRLVGLDELLER